MGSLVRVDGDRCGPNLPGPRLRQPGPQLEAVLPSAFVQLLLEHPVFQPSALWPGACMAGHTLGADPVYDPILPKLR